MPKNIKLDDAVYEVLLKCKGLLEYRDGKTYTFNDVVTYLLENAPEIKLPLGNGLRVELDARKRTTKNETLTRR